MNNIRNNFFFPLLLTLIFGCLTILLGKISEIQYEENALPAHEPQYLMTQISGTRFDDNGNIKEQLRAERAWQLPDQKNVFFSQPQLYVVHKKNTVYHVQAQDAKINLENKQLTFEHQVLLTQSPNNQQEQRRIQTEYLTIDTQKEIAQTNQTVHFQQGQSTGSANGMIYEYKNGKLNLPNKVKALIYVPNS